MLRIYLKGSLFLLICGLGMILSSPTHATENQLSFTTTVQQTKAKLDDATTDIKLKGHADSTVDLWVTVKNESQSNLHLEAKIKDAGTNNQGVIQYSSDQSVLNQALSLKKIANYEEVFTLAPGAVRDIKVTIQLPKKPFKGILLGGLQIKQKSEEDLDTMIKNSFSYSIPLVIVESEELLEAKLSFANVNPELTGGRNALKVSINNPISVLLSDATFKISVRKKNSDKVMYQERIEEVAFAPNSQFSHFLLMDNDTYEPGDYIADISVNSPYGEWKWHENFNIAKKVADKLNKESVSIPRMSTLLKGVIISVIFLVIIVIILVVYIIKVKRI